jgi:hypothetical protein
MADTRMDMSLPLTPEGVTAQWLTAALQIQRPGVTVEAAEVTEVINGTSTKIRVRASYGATGDFGLPTSLIVKGGFEEHSPWMAKMYADEACFYRDVKPYLDMNTPACFFAGSDPSSHQSIVILEDLSARNVVFQTPLVPSSYDQLARRLDAMARYHAQTWNSPEFQPGGRFDWMQSRYENPQGAAFIARYLEPERWRHFMAQPRGAAVSVRLHDRDWMAGALSRLAEDNKRWPQVVIHGDTHLGNLYLEADGTPGFLDAQVCKAPWQMEVNYHLIAACDVADRRRWEASLLTRYLERLKGFGAEPPSFEEAWLAYRRETAYGYFIFVINESFFQTESVNTAQAARFSAAALDHGTIELLS